MASASRRRSGQYRDAQARSEAARACAAALPGHARGACQCLRRSGTLVTERFRPPWSVPMAEPVLIRPERPGDADAIRHVNERAFGQAAEARLVDALREAGVLTLSLVAESAGMVVGHLAFSPVTIAGPAGTREAVGLAPMAVLPERQGQGIGALLVRAGLEALRAAGHGAVVVLGHPHYYPRFGFAPASRWGLRWERDCPDEAFMALELRAGALEGAGGVVRFRPEFDEA
jgi:putative acetyltransferase